MEIEGIADLLKEIARKAFADQAEHRRSNPTPGTHVDWWHRRKKVDEPCGLLRRLDRALALPFRLDEVIEEFMPEEAAGSAKRKRKVGEEDEVSSAKNSNDEEERDTEEEHWWIVYGKKPRFVL